MDANRFKPYVADRGPSVNLWRGFDFSQLMVNPGYGFHLWDDFLKFPRIAAPAADYVFGADGYSIHLDGSTTGNGAFTNTGIDIETNETQNAHGILGIDSAGTAVDNEAAVVLSGAAAKINGSLLTAFECRVKVSSIADSLSTNFWGLLNPSQVIATAVPLTAAGPHALVDTDYIGFFRGESDGDAISFVYKNSGQTAQTLIASAKVPVADTWVKLGFRIDPQATNTQRLSVWVDGAELTTYGTSANVAAATFPNDAGVAPCLACKAASTNDYGVISMDWWRFAQMRP